MQDPRDSLLLVARLRAALRSATLKRALSEEATATLSRQLADIEASALSAHEPVELPELLGEIESAELAIDLGILKGGLRTARLQRLDELRASALDRGVLTGFAPNVPTIELHEFDWSQLIRRWEELASAVLNPDISLDDLTRKAQLFYDPGEHGAALPIRFAHGLRRLIPRLIKIRALSPELAPDRIKEIRIATEALKDAVAAAHVEIGMDGRIDGVGEAQFRALETFTGLQDAPMDLGAALAAWRGPFYFELADRWLRSRSSDTDESLQLTTELLYARTGVDAYGTRDHWDELVTSRAAFEQEELLRLRAVGSADAAVAGLSFMLSQRATPDATVETHWWPLVERLREYHAPVLELSPLELPLPYTRPSTPAAAGDIPMQAATAAAVVHAQAQPEVSAPAQKPSAPDAFEFVPAEREPAGEVQTRTNIVPEDDAEFVSAPDKPVRDDDTLVESKSTWSVYLRPFLSENWLGLIGVTSLMAAWMFLTMWLWDKGQSYRIGRGAVPLLGLTLGTAWAARFIAKLPDAAPRAVSLFSALALLSVPFNFALGATLLGIDSVVARTAGAVLGLAYIAATPWVSARIAPSFGHDVRRFLLESNIIGYAPALVILVAGPQWLEASLIALIFVSLGALARGLGKASQFPASFRLSWMLFAIACLLVNAIPHVFFRLVPSVEVMGLVAQAVAILVALFGNRQPMALLIGALISATGLLSALVNPAWLPATFLAATAYWWMQSRNTRAPWPAEILAVHIIGTAVAVAWWLGMPEFASIGAVGAMVLVTRLEARSAIEVLHYALPLTLAGAATTAGLAVADSVSIVNGIAATVCAVWGHWRFSGAYRNGLYFANLGLAAIGGYAIVVAGLLSDPFAGGAIIVDHVDPAALYVALVSAAWALGSPWLRDPLTVLHKTVVTWVLGLIAALLAIATAQLTGILESTSTQLAFVATTVALVIGAARSRSSVPSYLGLVVLGVAGVTLKSELGLGSSGMGAAISGAAALFLAAGLRRWRGLETWPREHDGWFGRPFPLAGTAPFSPPLEWAAMLAALVASVQGAVLFAPANAMPKTALALTIAALVLARLAYVRQLAWPGYTAVAAAIVLMASITSMADVRYWPHVTLGWLTAAVLVTLRLTRASQPMRTALGNPLRNITLAATWLSVPAALLAYGVLLLSGASPELLGAWFLAATAFVVIFIVPMRPRWLVHLAFVHGALGWTLALVFMHEAHLKEFPVTTLVAGAFALLLCVALAFESESTALKKAYARGAWGWLAILAVAGLALGLTLAIDGAYRNAGLPQTASASPVWVEAALSWFALEMVCRRWRHGLLTFAKALTTVWFANMLIIGSPYATDYLEYGVHLKATLAGLVVFVALELLLRMLGTRVGERLRAVPFVTLDWSREQQNFHRTVYLGAIIMVAVHVWLLAVNSTVGQIEHYWLYGAAALMLWQFSTYRTPLMLYTGTGLFVYTNCFMAVSLLPRLPLQDVGVLHALASAFVISLGCFLALSTWLRRGESR